MLALIRALPSDSALHRDIDPEGAAWENTHELLATVIEHLDAGNRLLFSVHRSKGTKVPPPVHIPRPGERHERKAPAKPTHDEIVRFFSGVR